MSIAKAGIICTLNARTAILASANPQNSRYDPSMSVVEILQLPPTLAQRSAKMILVDPPYLSDECFTKTAETVRYLAADGVKILACTGLCGAGEGGREGKGDGKGDG